MNLLLAIFWYLCLDALEISGCGCQSSMQACRKEDLSAEGSALGRIHLFLSAVIAIAVAFTSACCISCMRGFTVCDWLDMLILAPSGCKRHFCAPPLQHLPGGEIPATCSGDEPLSNLSCCFLIEPFRIMMLSSLALPQMRVSVKEVVRGCRAKMWKCLRCQTGAVKV